MILRSLLMVGSHMYSVSTWYLYRVCQMRVCVRWECVSDESVCQMRDVRWEMSCMVYVRWEIRLCAECTRCLPWRCIAYVGWEHTRHPWDRVCSWYLHEHLCMHVYVCICACMHMCVYVFHIDISMCAYMYMYVYVRVCKMSAHDALSTRDMYSLSTCVRVYI